MQVRALVSLSGPMGEKAVGDEFVVNAKDGESLVLSNQVEQVAEPVKPAKADKKEQ